RELKINDINKGVVAFWYCTTQRTDELIRLIETTEVNIKKAKEIKAFYIEYRNQEITTMHKDLILKLGFSFFYLNRVNFSGIIQAGIIGGNEQKSEYNISCRFNKQILIERIKEISLKKAQIKVTNTDELIYSYSPYHRNQFKIQKI
ncbi:MAG: DNA adenine methylase, partial [Fusobacteriaceae bacterium]|nr:DNA adenine methylase [Fusobacteriaceae bacterium]